jgi:ribonuclease P protein component
MHAGRRGASASPSEPLIARLRKPEDFAALAQDRAAWRYCLQWICVAARYTSPDQPSELPTAAGDERDPAPALRFGFTVAKRQAKRAVMRVMVKRIMKESVRAAGPDLAARLGRTGGGRGLDVVLRLRNPLPRADGASAMSLRTLKRALRVEADALLQRLARHLDGKDKPLERPREAAERPGAAA